MCHSIINIRIVCSHKRERKLAEIVIVLTLAGSTVGPRLNSFNQVGGSLYNV